MSLIQIILIALALYCVLTWVIKTNKIRIYGYTYILFAYLAYVYLNVSGYTLVFGGLDAGLIAVLLTSINERKQERVQFGLDEELENEDDE